MKTLLYVILWVLIIWTALTIWAEYAGKQQIIRFKADNGIKNALIVYNPDPIYNLDEQLSMAIAKVLKDSNVSSIVVTDRELQGVQGEFELYIFLVNTYNFAPDRGIRKAIDKLNLPKGSKAVAITLGSGTTARAKRKFESFLNKRAFAIIQSEELWLLRPNIEDQMKSDNVEVAIDRVTSWTRSWIIKMDD